MDQRHYDISIEHSGRTYSGRWTIRGSSRHPTLEVSYQCLTEATQARHGYNEDIVRIMLRELVEQCEQRYPKG